MNSISDTNTILQLDNVIYLDHGSFGKVVKANYRGNEVAAKVFNSRASKIHQDFMKELYQLKRLSHPNIVNIIAYGKYQYDKEYVDTIVMEFAEDGSLFKILHEKLTVQYTFCHVIGWLYQTANAIHYLHSRTPKPIVHRDLKTKNLLLTKKGRVVKVCDFGTACDMHTVMTQDKGSTIYMGPEVFYKTDYNEKCDVYSFGIILWEILCRRIPYFDKALLNSFALMYHIVEKHLRPTSISKCPRILNLLYQKCVSVNPRRRPNMEQIAEIFYLLNQLVNREQIKELVY